MRMSYYANMGVENGYQTKIKSALWNWIFEQFEPPFMKDEYTEETLVAPGLPIKTWNNHSLFDVFIS